MSKHHKPEEGHDRRANAETVPHRKKRGGKKPWRLQIKSRTPDATDWWRQYPRDWTTVGRYASEKSARQGMAHSFYGSRDEHWQIRIMTPDGEFIHPPSEEADQ